MNRNRLDFPIPSQTSNRREFGLNYLFSKETTANTKNVFYIKLFDPIWNIHLYLKWRSYCVLKWIIKMICEWKTSMTMKDVTCFIIVKNHFFSTICFFPSMANFFKKHYNTYQIIGPIPSLHQTLNYCSYSISCVNMHVH